MASISGPNTTALPQNLSCGPWGRGCSLGGSDHGQWLPRNRDIACRPLSKHPRLKPLALQLSDHCENFSMRCLQDRIFDANPTVPLPFACAPCTSSCRATIFLTTAHARHHIILYTPGKCAISLDSDSRPDCNGINRIASRHLCEKVESNVSFPRPIAPSRAAMGCRAYSLGAYATSMDSGCQCESNGTTLASHGPVHRALSINQPFGVFIA